MKSSYSVNQDPGPVKPLIIQESDSLYIEQTASSYQWYRDSTAIHGAVAQSIKISEAGVYSVQVVTEHKCVSSSDYFYAKDPPAPIVLSENFTVEFYPNPAVDYLNVRLSLAEPSKAMLSIYDFQGRLMDSKEMSAIQSLHSESLEIAHYPAGTYLIRAKANNEIITRRFIKH
jgi:hypothetical protein